MKLRVFSGAIEGSTDLISLEYFMHILISSSRIMLSISVTNILLKCCILQPSCFIHTVNQAKQINVSSENVLKYPIGAWMFCCLQVPD